MSKLSYKKLFKMLIDIEMKNTELMEKLRLVKAICYLQAEHIKAFEKIH